MSIETRTARRDASLNRAAKLPWREGLPSFVEAGFTLRELQSEDAASLLAHLATEEVSRFISPPPTSIDGFERFIRWSRLDRRCRRRVYPSPSRVAGAVARGDRCLRRVRVGRARVSHVRHVVRGRGRERDVCVIRRRHTASCPLPAVASPP